MTYHKTSDDPAFFTTLTDHCVECGEPISGPFVSYDIQWPRVDTSMVTLLLHRRCASIMGQRLVCDSFIHRHEDEVRERGSAYR